MTAETPTLKEPEASFINPENAPDDSVMQAVDHLSTDLVDLRDEDARRLREEGIARVRELLKKGDVAEVIQNLDAYIEACGQEGFLTAYLDTRDMGLRDMRVVQMFRTGKFDPEVSEKFLTVLPPGGTSDGQRVSERIDREREADERKVEEDPTNRSEFRTSSDKGSKFNPHRDEIRYREDQAARRESNSDWINTIAD